MPTEVQCAYLAGFMDGEGSIGIGLLSKPNGGKRHTLVVTVVNTHLPTLQALQGIWGGGLTTRSSRKQGHKPLHALKWPSASGAAILEAIRPYMVTKANQAALALEFAATLRERRFRTKTLTGEEWDARECMRIEMRRLNGRGVVEQIVMPLLDTARPPLVCLYCGETFTTYQRRRMYCSEKCSMSAGRDAYVDRHTSTKTCPACGREFTARLKQKYCSIRCGRKIQGAPRKRAPTT